MYDISYKDAAFPMPIHTAGLSCESRACRYEYNSHIGFKVSGKTSKAYAEAVKVILQRLYANNAQLFQQVVSPDKQISSAAFWELKKLFPDGNDGLSIQ